jgi:hypothetical protein
MAERPSDAPPEEKGIEIRNVIRAALSDQAAMETQEVQRILALPITRYDFAVTMGCYGPPDQRDPCAP